MVSRANEEDLVPARLSPNDFDAQLAQPPPGRSVPANHIPTPSDEKGDLALASRLSQLTPDHFGEQAARFHCMGSAPASEKAHPFTPPKESDEDDLEVPADILDGQASELNRRRESCTAVEDSQASLPTAMSRVEVRRQHHRTSAIECCARTICGVRWIPRRCRGPAMTRGNQP